MAFGIHSNSSSTSARPALTGIALGASLGQAWRQLRRSIARSRQRRALAELNDRILRDIGMIDKASAREADQPFRRP
jgi:uncharacterized protein YjiS (DUF1127 family)